MSESSRDEVNTMIAILFLILLAVVLLAPWLGADTSDSRLRLTPDSFEFYESSCRVTDHKIVSQTASDLTFDCAGEGESWTRKLRAEVIDKGLRLTEDGVSVDYIACN